MADRRIYTEHTDKVVNHLNRDIVVLSGCRHVRQYRYLG
jgi:hypothetical protein